MENSVKVCAIQNLIYCLILIFLNRIQDLVVGRGVWRMRDDILEHSCDHQHLPSDSSSENTSTTLRALSGDTV